MSDNPLAPGSFSQWKPTQMDVRANMIMATDRARLMESIGAQGGASNLSSPTKADEKSPGKSKRKRPKFIRKVECKVCGDVANDHIHYGAIACYSCRAFFRRGVNANAPYYCSQNKSCAITKSTRKHCQYCRFQKCVDIGMKASWVMSEEDKQEKKEKAIIKKLTQSKEAGVLSSAAESGPEEMEEDTQMLSSPPPAPTPGPSNATTTSYMERRRLEMQQLNSKASPLSAENPFASPKRSQSPVSSSASPISHAFSQNINENSQRLHADRSPLPPHNPATAEYASPEPSPGPSLRFENADHYVRVPEPSISASFANPSPASPYDQQHGESRYPGSPMDVISYPPSPLADVKPDVSFFVEKAKLLTHQPVFPFTPEENHLVQSIINIELETTKSIPVNPDVLMSMINAARTGSVIPYKALVEGYTTCMKRIIKFASKLDFFRSFSPSDQRSLLLHNTDMIVNIRSARLLRPGINLQAQLTHATAGPSTETASSAVDLFRSPERLEYKQIFQSPWACDANHEEKFASLMENLFHLEMDKTTTALMNMLVLFSTTYTTPNDAERAVKNQEFFSQLLYRYLCSAIGRENSTRLLPKYLKLVSQLEEMAQIMISKRLTL